MGGGLKDLVRDLYAAVNAGRLEAVTDFYEPGLRSWAPPGDQPLSRDAVLAAFRTLRAAFPDFHDQVEALVASDDVGELAALAFDDPDAFPLPTEVAGDELPMATVADTFGQVLGRPVQYVAMPYESVAQFDPNLATLGAWLDGHGYGADIPALRRLDPGLRTMEDWLCQTGWATAGP